MTLPDPPPSEPSKGIVAGPAGSILLGLLALLILIGWLPHYLTWPWWADLDAYATIARGWDAGILPYRDVTIFNFPGQIELFWLLGHAFGWGRTWPIYALDASMTLGACGLLIWWSRRRFGSTFPGWVGVVALLHLAADQDYASAAQRDWQAPLLAAVGLLTLQAGRGRAARIAAGLMLGCAGAIRPHVILFAPAYFLAIVVEGRARGHGARRLLVDAAEWAGAAALALAIAFAPLAAQGLLGDFLAGVRKAGYGSSYNRTTPAGVVAGAWGQTGLGAEGWPPGTSIEDWDRLRDVGLVAVTIALVATAALGGARRVTAAPWACAMALAYLYAPLHPKSHAYLILPRLVFGCAALAASAGLAGGLQRPWTRRAAYLGLVFVALPGVPKCWDLLASLDAVGFVEPGDPIPPGARGYFAPDDPRSPYRWRDYRDTLRYLGERTTDDTPLANLLRNVPFPAVNGPVGRISPLPGESGLIWLWSVEPEREPEFAAKLADAPGGTVAVWDPDAPTFTDRLALPNVSRVVRREFRREATFGAFQVWRKPIE